MVSKLEEDMTEQELLSVLTDGAGQKQVQATLAAAHEIARRLAEAPHRALACFDCMPEEREYLAKRFHGLQEDIFAVACFDAYRNILDILVIYRGKFKADDLDGRRIFKSVLKYPAASVSFIRYFASSKKPASPSQRETEIYRMFASIGLCMDIPVDDLLYVSDGCWTSFRQILPKKEKGE